MKKNKWITLAVFVAALALPAVAYAGTAMVEDGGCPWPCCR
jgi:hypothetical protein